MEVWLDLIGRMRPGGKILLGVGILSSAFFAPGLVAQEDAVRMRVIPVKVTAYNPVRSQTDSSPLITASNKRVRVGMVALSRDLEREFGFRFGDIVNLDGIGRFVFEDRMNRRKRRHVDILMFNPIEARKFGVKSSYLFVLEGAKKEGRGEGGL
jgi:3D (Asp-Asp-Asp) domain-containing protein